MARIRTRQDRLAAERERVAEVARVLCEAEPAEASRVTIGRHVAADDQLPRIPVIGFEPGAIRGTIPHRCRVVARG